MKRIMPAGILFALTLGASGADPPPPPHKKQKP